MAKYSPMLEQYFGMKARYPEALLLSRVGDFYEAYGDDAETAARLLSIALTAKDSGNGTRVAMAGVPHHALDTYLAKLVQQRCVVALAEQLEVPVANKLVRRDVVRVVTPGTLLEEHFLDRASNNYLAALTVQGDVFAVAHADVSTGHLSATAFTGESAHDEVLAELGRLAAAEIVADVRADLRAEMEPVLATLGARITSPGISAVEPRPRGPIAGFSAEECAAIHRALDALYDFIKRTQMTSRDALRPATFYRQQTFLALDAQTRKHLELTKALGANPKATLLGTLDRCRSAMGSRMLARWLLAPLVDRSAIVARADAVQYLIEDYPRRLRLQELLAGCFDIERIAQKVRLRRATPKDLKSLARTLAHVAPLRAAMLVPELARIASAVADFDALSADLEATLTEEPPATLADGGVIRPAISPELAECAALRSDGRERLSALEERERARTGIKNLKLKYSGPFGYAFEVSKGNLGSVPQDFVRKQTLVNAERFVTPELKELENAISSASTRQLRIEVMLFDELIERVALCIDDLLATADALAELDSLASLAQVAAESNYVRPRFTEASILAIDDGRHPVMEALLGTAFVPNDLDVKEGTHRFLLLTGPNMGGKSTYLRQTALLVIMAQIGSFVPARSCEIGIVDRIFTRIGAGDDLASGQSTFYVEMAETAHILRRCTAHSLLLIDEVGRGTGTVDGLAIAQAICEYLLGLGDSVPMVLFATHFHELVALADEWQSVANFHVTAVENAERGGAPVFSHRILPGSTNRSFGIEVARMAGLPRSVVERARALAQELMDRVSLEQAVPLKGNLAHADANAPKRQIGFEF